MEGDLARIKSILAFYLSSSSIQCVVSKKAESRIPTRPYRFCPSKMHNTKLDLLKSRRTLCFFPEIVLTRMERARSLTQKTIKIYILFFDWSLEG